MSFGTNPSKALIKEAVRSFGWVRFRVLGTSMAPSVLPGDVVSVQCTKLDEISIGEIVLFSRGERLFVHRVVSRTSEHQPDRLITRGDRLGYDDPPIRESDFLGRVTSIQRGRRVLEPDDKLEGWRRVFARMLRTSELATRAYLHFCRAHSEFVFVENGAPALIEPEQSRPLAPQCAGKGR